MLCGRSCVRFPSRGVGIACWLERRTRDRNIASSNPGRSGGRIFFSRVNFVCWLLFGIHYIPVLPQWHVKDPGHSAKSADGKLHLNTHTLLTRRSRSGLTMRLFKCGNISGNELTRNSSGNTQSQSSQLAEPLWTDPGLKSGISVRKLISIKKKKKKHRRAMNCRTFSQNPRTRGKSHHHHHSDRDFMRGIQRKKGGGEKKT